MTSARTRANSWRRLLLTVIWCVLLAVTLSATTEQSAGARDVVAMVRGGVFHLRCVPARPLLLAFVQMVPDAANTASRRQAVFIQSMASQYAARGLRVALVDASRIANGSTAQHDQLINASYDWHLTVAVLEDTDGSLAKRFDVEQVPTTFLLKADGSVGHRWNGPISPANLAQQIERMIGGPLGGLPDLPGADSR